MAKILVADDNSNIQKMVGLALKDQGIDVVAVGNGEAAVRKISDMRPDLVLADVFMPVRNGYEVCEYVKADRSLSHIPVILLVGAFDPLDEQEAQRVGADGVLKKPFVPPDPLISMVKSALARSGIAPGRGASGEAVRGAPLPVRDVAAPVLASVPLHSHGPEEPSREAFSSAPRPVAVEIPEGSQPLAFGNLLSTPAPAPPQEAAVEAEDASYVVPRHPNLDEERSWNAAHTEEASEKEEEAEESAPSGWTRDAADEDLEENIPAGAHRDWQDAKFASEKQTEEAEPAEAIEAAPVANFPEPHAIEEQIARLRSPWNTPAPPPTSPTIVTPETAPTASAEPPQESAARSREVSPAEFSLTPAETHTPPPVESQPAAGSASWFSVSSSPWDAEVKKVNQLADTWNVGAPSAPGAETPAPPVPPIKEAHPPAFASAPPVTEITQSLVEQTLKEAQTKATAGGAPAKEPAPAEAPSAAPAPDMDALVKKVLDTMSPDMLQSMTRELLKPVVEAIVRGELNLKK